MKKIIFFLSIILASFSFAQSDCSSSITLCADASVSYTPTGPGVQENLGGGCLSTEHFSVWYQFTAATSGTLTFLISPNSQNDYDFAVYGPNKTCGNLGAPIRCSYAGTGSGILTGLNTTSTDLTEGAGGDGFVRYLDVIAGDSYQLIVDNFSSSTVGFVLTFGGTATLASPFSVPALAPNPFLMPGPNNDGNVVICTNPATFDFSTLSAQIINGNPDFVVSYYNNINDAIASVNPIIGATTVNTANTYHYTINYVDPTNPNAAANKCKQYGTINFTQGAIVVNDTTLSGCSNNNSGVALYNLTTANVFAGPPGLNTFQYYPTLADLNAGTNLIPNPTTYNSAQGTVYVKVTTPEGCTGSSKITLIFFAPIVQTPVELISCFIEENPTTALFDLTTANVTTTTGVTRQYYLSNQDAINQTNPIANAAAYVATSSEVFVRVTSAEGCWNIVKVTLEVTPPVYSLVLKDKIICVEDITTLDAGPGFTAYLWSTGETTQSITNVSVGSYFVYLTTNDCVTKQNVKVLASPTPVVTSIEIANNSATVTVNGGVPPYQYSIDGTNFQDSNVFTNLPRGQNTMYVKDNYNCDPVIVDVTVPNLVNAITPNGDGVNDFVDYSSLANKTLLTYTVYDRYGNKIHVANKENNFRWDGTINGGKKLSTGTYWYTITWVEPTSKILINYTGWIVVKNK
ncbi:T9SS type B sorting domain-containing protein [Frigoriflavimonas asaccharolytica]|uniref:Gliding motility-associated-like protein n=1 Tax=Frigoriflavimonas asaccharolytica TaxID=2735899 RepID=A0A8J8G9U1_9FLAO|nr:T9SS type B sorting domain-containing protein [Frigoriflavimonas asaccharolytica]NRS92189.1 gliding motility-associated-like protein [Frigoriflavimonas asaccharolytica]